MLGTPPQSPQLACRAAPEGACAERQRLHAPQEFSIADDEDDPDDGEASSSEAACTELAVRAATAKQARLAIVGGAEARVRLRGLEVSSEVEVRRCAEEQATERCRIAEEARTQRLERLAGAAELLVQERQRTQREREALRAQALHAAIAVRGQVETCRIQAQAGMLNVFQWTLASLVGAFGASAAGSGPKLLKARGRRRRPVALSPYLSALVLVAFVRHLWQNVGSRRLLVWSDGLGPFLRGTLRKALQGALSLLLQGQHSMKDVPAAKAGAAGPPPGANDPMDALRRLAAGKPLPGPEAAPDCWVSWVAPGGRTFWHHTALGPAPWEAGAAAAAPGQKEEKAGGLGALATPPRTCTAAKGDNGPGVGRRLRALLANWGLGEYAEALERNGYDPEVLKVLRFCEAEDMLRAIECKPGHVDLFRKALDSWR